MSTTTTAGAPVLEDEDVFRTRVRDFLRANAQLRVELGEVPAFVPRDVGMAFQEKLFEAGLAGLTVPAEYGGAGMDYIALGVASEELEYVDTSLRVILSVHTGLNSLTLLQ